MTKRIQWLDSLRGVAMIAVIFGHIHSMSDKTILLMYAFHMPLFFMISGATFRANRYANVVECLIDQAKKLLLPYAMLFAANLPLWYINRKILSSSAATACDLLSGFISGNQVLGTLSNGALWFLPCLFMVSVLFYALTRLDEEARVPLSGSIVIVFLFVVYLSMSKRPASFQHWATVPMATIFYYLGWLFMQYWEQLLDIVNPRDASKPNYAGLCAIVLLSIGVWTAFENGKISMHANKYHTIALTILAACALSLGLALCVMNLPKSKLLPFIGQNSMAYLGFHIPIIRFLENFGPTKNFADSHAMATALFVILIMIPISLLVNRCCPILVGKYRRRA